MEVLLPRGGWYQRTIVAHRKRDVDDELIVLCNSNPISDNRVYEAVFIGGEGAELLANRVY